MSSESKRSDSEGMSFGDMGCVIAAIISAVKYHSIGWMILHSLLGWLYVIYYIIRYGFHIG